MRALLAIAVLWAVAALGVAGCGGKSSVPSTTVAVFGDTPYGRAQVENFPSNVAEISADPTPAMVIHLGDIKISDARCTDAYFRLIRSDFDRFRKPLVYTPGDNEWTDCHRANNGGFNPVERLTKLRQVFFDPPGHTLGDRSMILSYQRDYPENVLWHGRGIAWGVLNIPASNNDAVPWFQDPGQHYSAARKAQQRRELAERTGRDLQWIDRIFAAAEKEKAKVVVIGIQADMWDPEIFAAGPPQYDRFTPLVRRLATRASEFEGQVLLLNGDSHKYKRDRPLADPGSKNNRTYGVRQAVTNLTRIVVQGDTEGTCKEWLRLTVRPGADAPFSAERVHFKRQPTDYAPKCPAR